MDQITFIKIVSALIYPLGLFVVLNILALFSRLIRWVNLSRGLVVVAWAGLILASNPRFSDALVASLESKFPQQAMGNIQQHDAIIVLGGGLRIPLPPARSVQLSSGSDRYWHAAKLYQERKAGLIILAGGNVFLQPGFKGEAFYAAQLLQDWGVPPQAIKIESESRNTEQNIGNISAWLSEQGISSVLLVTSAYHMPRALKSLTGLPLAVTPASADILVRESRRPGWLTWLPSAAALNMTTLALHEYYGMAFLALKKSF